MEIIRQHCIDRLPAGVQEEEGWEECVKAIHKIQYDIRNGRVKEESLSKSNSI